MKWIGKIILLYVVLNSCESANEKITFNSNYSIIPKPQQLSITEGFFEISEKTCFYYDSSEIKVVEFLTNYLEENFKFKGKNKTSNQIATNKIYFLKEDGVLGKIDDYQINDINLTIDKSYNEKILKIGKKKYFKIIVK